MSRVCSPPPRLITLQGDESSLLAAAAFEGESAGILDRKRSISQVFSDFADEDSPLAHDDSAWKSSRTRRGASLDNRPRG